MTIPGEQSFEGDDITITNVFRTIAEYRTREVGISVRFIPAWSHPFWQPIKGRYGRTDDPAWGSGDRWASVSVPRVSALNGLRPGTFHNWPEWFSRLRRRPDDPSDWPDGSIRQVLEVKLWPGPP